MSLGLFESVNLVVESYRDEKDPIKRAELMSDLQEILDIANQNILDYPEYCE